MTCCPELFCGVVVNSNPTFGATAFASRPFAIGDVVLCEEPMLTMLGNRASDDVHAPVKGFEEVAKACNVPLAFFDAILSIVLSPASFSDVLRIEASLFSPSCALQSRVERQAVALSLSDEFFARCFPADCASFPFWRQCREFKEKGIARVLKLLHACRVNVHEAFGSGYLFDKASKFAHSCNANTFWVMHREPTPRVMHVALRPIAEDEILSFSYVGTGLNLLLPALHRREMLSDLSFTCCCPRCVAASPMDASRSLKCPQCTALSLSLNVVRGEWACSDCEATFGKEEALSRILFDERAIGTAVMQLFFGRVGRDSDAVKLWEAVENSTATRELAKASTPLLQRWAACTCVGDILGFDHYLFACAFAGLVLSLMRGLEENPADGASEIHKLLDHLRVTATPDSPWTTTLRRWYVRFNGWLLRNVPGGAHEARFMLLFAAVVDELLSQLLLTVEEHEVLDGFRAMLLERGEHPRQQFGALLKYSDFAPRPWRITQPQ
jgi:hypothetical protein